MPQQSRTPLRGPVRTVMVAALLGSLALTGCGSKSEPTPSPSESRTTLSPHTSQIEVAVGQSAQLGLGEMNLSVGDGWGVVSQQPSGIVEAKTVTGEKVFGYTQPPEDVGKAGAPTVGAIQITGTRPGTTKLKVVYCFRDTIREGCNRGYSKADENQPKTITVTVH